METRKLFFETSVFWKERTTGIMVSPSADEPVEVATPIEFPDGEEGKWSPECLFLGAISSCFITTFLSFAKRKNLGFIKLRCHSEGEVELINGKLEFTHVDLYPEVYLMEEDQVSLAKEVLLRTEKHCLIANSVKATITTHAEITCEEAVTLS